MLFGINFSRQPPNDKTKKLIETSNEKDNDNDDDDEIERGFSGVLSLLITDPHGIINPLFIHGVPHLDSYDYEEDDNCELIVQKEQEVWKFLKDEFNNALEKQVIFFAIVQINRIFTCCENHFHHISCMLECAVVSLALLRILWLIA